MNRTTNALLTCGLALLAASWTARAEEPSKLKSAEAAASSAAMKTGHGIKKGVGKAADAVGTTAERTGQGIKNGVAKGSNAVKRGAKRAKAAVTPASSPN